MTQEQDPKLVELPVRFSSSKIWQIQRNYFASMGIKAFKEEVPFYISNNAFIGKQYALLLINIIKDWLTKYPDSQETFYFLEVGAGTGKLCFHVLKSLKEMLAQFNLSQVKFCYVISDVIEKYVSFCQENPSFSTYVENGEVDFATFDVEKDTDFFLHLKQKNYTQLSSKTPLVIFANYTFDAIKQDEFEYEDDKFYEIKLEIKSRYKHFDVEKSQHLDDLRLNFVREEITTGIAHYYQNEILNQILLDYPKYFKDKKARIMMPIGAFEFLDNIKRMTNNNALIVVGDKGISVPEFLAFYGEKTRYSYDGCYSFMVNFHAIGEYLLRQGGDYLPTRNSNDFKVNLYSLGTQFNELINTKAYFQQNIESVGPEEFIYFYDEFLTTSFRFSLKSVLAFIRFSEWDPNAYGVVHERIMELLPVASRRFIEDLKVDLDKVKANIYSIGIGDDVYNLIGMNFYMVGETEKAMALYNQSLAVFGEKSAPHSNLGLAYEKQKNIPKALFHFEKAVALDKTSRFAKSRLLQLSGKPYLNMFLPVAKGLFVFGLIALALYVISR